MGADGFGFPPNPDPDLTTRRRAATIYAVKILTGKVSWFGGPTDSGVLPDERLALYPQIRARDLGTGLLTDLYCAMRWDYAAIAAALKLDRASALTTLRNARIVVYFSTRGQLRSAELRPADWGPASKTGRLIDVSHQVIDALGANTDDQVKVQLPDWISISTSSQPVAGEDHEPGHPERILKPCPWL